MKKIRVNLTGEAEAIYMELSAEEVSLSQCK